MGRRASWAGWVLVCLLLPWLQGAEGFFGMQAIPKFDERLGRGAWSGSRERGLAMHRDLGVQLSREGYPWPQDEPEPGRHPDQADFDDAIDRCASAGIRVELMVMGVPYWASLSPDRRPTEPDSYRRGVPRDLYLPVFTDGSDVPGRYKQINPRNPTAALYARIAARYRGRVAIYQVGNEPDFPEGDLRPDTADPRRSFQGSVRDYARMLQVAQAAVRQVDPAARIATGGLGHASYLAALIAEGAGAYFDVLDFHAYGGRTSDEALAAFLRVHLAMWQVLAQAHLERPMLCSETGYPGADAEGQAAYIPKLFATGLALGLVGIAWYAPTDPSWQQMGLVDWRSMSRRRVGYWSYKNVATALGGARYLGRMALPPTLVGYRYQTASGEVRLLWAPYRDASRAVAWRADARWRVVRPDGSSTWVEPGTMLPITAAPVILDAALARAYARPRPNPPLRAGRVALTAVRALGTDGSGFHEPELAVDGDADTEWVGTELLLALAPGARVQLLSLKTGPITGLRLEGSRDGVRWEELAAPYTATDWAMHELRLPERALRYLRLRAPGGHARIFELELR